MKQLELLPPPLNGKQKYRKKRNTKPSNDLTKAIIHYVNKSNIGFLYRVQKGLVVVKRFADYKGECISKMVRPVGMINGIFDIEGIAPDGLKVIVEVKIGKDKLQKEQIFFGNRIGKFGGYVIAAKTFNDFRKKYDMVLERKQKELFVMFQLEC